MPAAESFYVREIAKKYLVGKGLDVGCGAEKVLPDAIGIDLEVQYGIPGHPKTAADEIGMWFECARKYPPASLDYIFSSHLLEDFSDLDFSWHFLTMLTCIKRGGHLMLYLPVEDEFKAHCAETGQVYNNHHEQNWHGVTDFLNTLKRMHFAPMVELVESGHGPGPYSFYVVLRKV